MWPAFGAAMAGKAPSPGAFALGQASAKQAQEWQEHFYQNRFKWMMNDMRNAGLNPILAYREAGPGTPSGGGQSVHGGGFDMGGASSAARTSAMLNLEKAEAQQRIAESQARAAAAEATARETNARTDLLDQGRSPVTSPMHEVQRSVIDWIRSGEAGRPGDPVIRPGSLLDKASSWIQQGAKEYEGMKSGIHLLPMMKEALDGEPAGGSTAKRMKEVFGELWKFVKSMQPSRSRFHEEAGEASRRKPWRKGEVGRWEKDASGEWRKVR